MVKTTVEVKDDLWRVVRIKKNKEDTTVHKALEGILEDYIEDHGEEYGYPIDEVGEEGNP